MKPKEIIIVIAAVVFIGLSGFAIYKMLGPTKSANTTQTQNNSSNTTITGVIDQTTLSQITEKKDYGEASLDNIGRSNPFGPLN